MSVPPRAAASFAGPVRVHTGIGPLNLRLHGCGQPAAGARPLTVSFGSAAIPPGLPAELTDALIEPAAPGAWRIRCGPSEWVVTARAVHVHEDPASAFNRALPPRRVPLHKRLFWGMVLTLVRSPTGRRLLLRLRG